jgi:tRNA threonylcarbamoyladenosine biosynthesis protein TsaB
MPALLAIDTAAAILSIALEVEEQTWYFEANAGLRHSDLAMDIIDLLLKNAGIDANQLSAALCMGGPGSFTGLRIGFSIAKGLGLAQGIPFIPIPSLDCMAWPWTVWPGLVIPVMDAKKNAFFCAVYQEGRRLTADMDAEPARIAGEIKKNCREPHKLPVPLLLTGPDAEKLRPFLEKELPEGMIRVTAGPPGGYARELLAIAKKGKLLDNYTVDWFSGPEYIRKSDAELHIH